MSRHGPRLSGRPGAGSTRPGEEKDEAADTEARLCHTAWLPSRA